MADPYQPVYLDTAEKAGLFVDSIADVREIALDTEGASFHRYVDRIYLLQLSTQHHSAIIDPLHAGALPKLGALMENREVEVIFHDADYDLRLLRQDYGWHTTHVFDTRIAAQLLGIPAFGLAALLEKFFSVKLDKQHQRADWSMRPLTPSMLDYAAQDTRYLLDLRDELRTGLEALGRMSWAEEEFERLESIQFAPDDPATGFMRTKGARDLKRRELAVLKELVAWRDERAAALDRATFRVMGSEAMFEIARVHPKTREELAAIKGVPRGVVERHAQDLLDAVQRGLAVPEADLPRFPRAPRWDRDPDFDSNVAKLKSVRDAAAARLKLDPGVLCARDRMEAVARRKPKAVEELAEIPELRRWQASVLGSDFVAALRG
ncbi:MAG TPA: HRDC domain-containing protein [Gemmatimonadaceae bacterium]|nr:HRDC domain-containing protein [Gemmatimonadaceae bacterium]